MIIINKYFMINIPIGEYSVMVSYLGYRTELREHIKVTPDKTTFVNFKLTKEREINKIKGSCSYEKI